MVLCSVISFKITINLTESNKTFEYLIGTTKYRINTAIYTSYPAWAAVMPVAHVGCAFPCKHAQLWHSLHAGVLHRVHGEPGEVEESPHACPSALAKRFTFLTSMCVGPRWSRHAQGQPSLLTGWRRRTSSPWRDSQKQAQVTAEGPP